MLSVVRMLRGLWVALSLGVLGCARTPPTPAIAPAEEPAVVFLPEERDPDREATDKLIAELHEKQLKEKARSDAARAAAAEPKVDLTEEEWLAVAREHCHPMHCDGSSVRPSCVGEYDIPTWARVQAATEACDHSPPKDVATTHEGTQVLSKEDWAAWRKRVTGK